MTSKTKAYEEIGILVQRFQDQYNYFIDNKYSEAEVRKDFIDKFFTALGWDVDHNYQHNPYTQEVKVEKSQKQSHAKAQKRADYAFFLKPDYKNPKFFVEAKKPARDLKNADDYFQTIRYGWNAGTGVSVLTDFQELHIIDSRFKPDISQVFTGHHEVFHYRDYLNEDKFSKIYWLLSHEAVEAGNIEKYVERLPKPKGAALQVELFGGRYQSIDDSFLEYIDDIRLKLANAFKKNDENLDSEMLTEATQRTIDRLVFIRFLEDKLIEPENYVSEFGMKASVWKDFISVCHKLDVKYNGIVFKRHPIDSQDFSDDADRIFRDVCTNISHLNTPYDFNAIPVHILGSIYERFLGKIVIATEKRVKIETKPEVQKAGGVYYTPKYIVDHIVKETIGVLIEGKTPKEISKLKFADIACGSGSFLIGVLECLFEYHSRYYNAHHEEAKRDKCLKIEGAYVLSIKQKQQILLNNVFGVDLDHQATEVTQLSLYLKMLEDETTATANEMMILFHEKILPDLSNNVQSGNSLIGTDILSETLFQADEERALNPFDYRTAFPQIFKQGGFDAIVGNPPWVDIKGLNPVAVDYYFNKYNSSENRINLYALFVEKCLMLLNKKGILGYIIPNSILFNSSYLKLRTLILDKYHIKEIVRLPDNVFKNVKAETVILLAGGDYFKDEKTKCIIYHRQIKLNSISEDEADDVKNLSTEQWKSHELKTFDIFSNEHIIHLLQTIEKDKEPLVTSLEFCLGLTPYDKAKGQTQEQIKSRVYHANYAKNRTYKKMLEGANVGRYRVSNEVKEYISYGNWLGAPREQKFFTSERILVRQIVSGTPLRIYAGYTTEELYNGQSIFNLLKRDGVKENMKYFLALLNSKLINFYHSYKYLDLSKRLFQKILIQNAKNFPTKRIDFSNKDEKKRHDELVILADQIIHILSQLSSLKTEKEGDYILRKLNSLDSKIDEIVYSLYGLSDAEIETIEEFWIKAEVNKQKDE